MIERDNWLHRHLCMDSGYPHIYPRAKAVKTSSNEVMRAFKTKLYERYEQLRRLEECLQGDPLHLQYVYRRTHTG